MSPRNRPVIAIDGPAGVGKSTLAKRLADALDFIRLDTGAMYRALALKALESDMDLDVGGPLGSLAQQTSITLEPMAHTTRVLMDGQDVTQRIRDADVTQAASRVSVHPAVRQWMVDRQRILGEKGGVVMEGRDIGTVVFPDAELKLFLEASEQARAGRRWREEAGKEIEHYVTQVDKNMPPEEEILRQLRERDDRDRSRAASPLHAAEDAVVLDTTALDEDAVLAEVLKVIASRWPDLPVRRARGERGEPLAPAGPAGPRGES
jgi:CMP/dCMP kinase